MSSTTPEISHPKFYDVTTDTIRLVSQEDFDLRERWIQKWGPVLSDLIKAIAPRPDLTDEWKKWYTKPDEKKKCK